MSVIQVINASGGAGPRSVETGPNAIKSADVSSTTQKSEKPKKNRSLHCDFEYGQDSVALTMIKIVGLRDKTHNESIKKIVKFKNPVINQASFDPETGKKIREVAQALPDISYIYEMNDEYGDHENRKDYLRYMLEQHEQNAIRPFTQFHINYIGSTNSSK